VRRWGLLRRRRATVFSMDILILYGQIVLRWALPASTFGNGVTITWPQVVSRLLEGQRGVT